MIQTRKTIRRSGLTLIELLVAMTALLLIMSFLMSLIGKINQLAVVQRNQTDISEKQRLAFDIISRDLQGMVVSDTPGSEINYGMDGTTMAFVTASGIGTQPTDTCVLQEVVYTYDPGNLTMSRYRTPASHPNFDFLGDTNVAAWASSFADSTEFLSGVNGISIVAYDLDDNVITTGTDTAMPAYVDIVLALDNDDRDTSDTFAKRIYMKRDY